MSNLSRKQNNEHIFAARLRSWERCIAVVRRARFGYVIRCFRRFHTFFLRMYGAVARDFMCMCHSAFSFSFSVAPTSTSKTSKSNHLVWRFEDYQLRSSRDGSACSDSGCHQQRMARGKRTLLLTQVQDRRTRHRHHLRFPGDMEVRGHILCRSSLRWIFRETCIVDVIHGCGTTFN